MRLVTARDRAFGLARPGWFSHARGQFGLGDVLLLKDLLELEGNHALEGQHLHLRKDAFPGEKIAEVTATVGVL